MCTKILAIIVSYNFEPWIERCLGSLRHSELPVDVVVIDNCSVDHTVDLIKGHFPDVRLICSDENLGFGRANNMGFKIALEEGYEAVFMLNQDAWIEESTIGVLASLCREYPQYGVLSPIHLTGSGDRLDHGFAIYSGIDDFKRIDRGQHITPLPFINAAFWMIPVKVLQKVGGFCPLFYHYGEDKDYVNRLNYHGYFAGYSSLVLGWHDREGRVGTLNEGFRAEFVYLLTELMNINYTLKAAVRHSIKVSIKNTCLALRERKWKHFKEWISITSRLCCLLGKVVYYRKRNISTSSVI